MNEPGSGELSRARAANGLRLATWSGAPSPWGEALRGILHVKRLPHMHVQLPLGSDTGELIAWTGQPLLPVLAWEGERPLTGWLEQLQLAERLQPSPTLIPAAVDDRVLMFGLSRELCGELGLGWQLRLMMLHPGLSRPDVDPAGPLAARGRRFGYSAESMREAKTKALIAMKALAAQLERQSARGRRYFIGEELSALDIYWAAFAALIEPLPDELCRLRPSVRQMFTQPDPDLRAVAEAGLLQHRDFIYKQYLELPVRV